MKLLRVRVLVTMTFLLVTAVQGQESVPNPRTEGLSASLLQLAVHFKISIVAEVVEPMPQVQMTENGAKADIETSIARLRTQCPNYVFRQVGNVLVVSRADLLRAKLNPLNRRLTSYRVPSNLTYFKQTFPYAVQNVGKTLTGGAFTGVGLPEKLSPLLVQEELKGKSAREILIHIGRELGTLYSIFILPASIVDGKTPVRDPFLGWEVAGGEGLNEYVPYLRHLPER